MSHLKRLQIHRRLVYANIFPGPEFLRTSTISEILRGILGSTGRLVLYLQGEVARRYLRLNGENMQMNFCPLLIVQCPQVSEFLFSRQRQDPKQSGGEDFSVLELKAVISRQRRRQ